MFHNARSGHCFPSYERIAEKAGCARSTVAEALKALEFAGVLTWQNRITRIRERCRDLWGHEGWRWRVVRTSNCYRFVDPKTAELAGVPSKSGYRTGTSDQEVNPTFKVPDLAPKIGIERERTAPEVRDSAMTGLAMIAARRMQALGLA